MARETEHDDPDQAARDLAQREPRNRPRQRNEEGIGGDPALWRCGGCDCPFVQPLDWDLVGRSHWRVTLRCPNCEWIGTGVFSQEAVDRFDRELDRGMRKLQSTLARVSRACMEADIESFAQALESDLIVPFDF
ncbi:MAG TPA: hypothetical protein VHM72_11755 [Solirubrobacteraceae bacterium]|jgi:hypothetical protein|nr:hypothetical protein [Solirubrobacteraceae bacterium]